VIPPFDATGLLSPGLHPASLPEITERFGEHSELRRAQMESIRWMIDLARRAGVERIVLNGSFVTDILEPNDVDCVLLSLPGTQRDRSAIRELLEGLPFLSVAIVDEDGFDELVSRFFATDRLGRSKGMIEVIE
jgi:hypothetical protein